MHVLSFDLRLLIHVYAYLARQFSKLNKECILNICGDPLVVDHNFQRNCSTGHDDMGHCLTKSSRPLDLPVLYWSSLKPYTYHEGSSLQQLRHSVRYLNCTYDA